MESLDWGLVFGQYISHGLLKLNGNGELTKLRTVLKREVVSEVAFKMQEEIEY